ncbi:Six-hairpin glycosidase-like protein [Biscogniauxia marginata]|nr:Six-hairpin glycosidase-like protein [Biscogniauxia marginata]
MVMKPVIDSLLLLALPALVHSVPPSGIDYHNLPNETIFSGPWDDYIKAPANKSFITPVRIWNIEGNVTTPTKDGRWPDASNYHPSSGILIGEGGLITVEFGENIAGRVCLEVASVAHEPVIKLAYSESSFFVGRKSDATNDEEWDLPLPLHVGNRTGTVCVDPEFIRGGFKYLTLYIDWNPVLGRESVKSRLGGIFDSVASTAQKVLGLSGSAPHVSPDDEKKPPSHSYSYSYATPSVVITQVWANCTSFPSQANGRAYSGYFYSSSALLNRVWYAGAYTLQLSTIDPAEGSALVPVNRYLDHNRSPPGSWYSNFTVAAGAAVTTDGAKRDRLVWPGDMYVAIPGIAVSSYDMLAVRNALDVIYEHQYGDDSLPYAGPPLYVYVFTSRGYHNEFSDTYHLHTLLGTYDYVLYSGDLDWLRRRWPAYKRALRISTSKVDSYNLMHVSSRFDWNRHGMKGHNIEASAILYTVLKRSIELASWLSDDVPAAKADGEWARLCRRLEKGIEQLYCPTTGLYSDNLSSRHCTGPAHVDPQDGNSWALIAGMHGRGSEIPRCVSRALRARWNRFGAPAPEFPNVMSPFASSFELQAHRAAGDPNAAVELALLMWGYLLDGPGFTNSTLAEGFRTDGYVHYPAYPVPSRNSHAHGWAAGPTGALVAGGVLGIGLRAPGGAEWEVRPAITRWLGWARGGFAVRRGRFEVWVWRVRLLGDGDGDGDSDGGKATRLRKGVVAVVSGPEGTRGRFGWGDEERGAGFEGEVRGGETRAWVRWEDGDGRGATEELDGRREGQRRDDERWFDQRMPWRGGVLVFDDEFEEPAMQEREPGTVDWEELERGYADSARGRRWE